MLAPLPGPPERVVHHPPHPEGGVQADLGGHLVRGAHPDRAARAGVGPFGALPHHDEVDVGISGQRACHTRIQPGRPQIDVVVEFEANSQQQATFQHATGHRRVTDRAQQDRIVRTQLVENRIG